MSTVTETQTLLKQLMAGAIRASKIVGQGGYKYPKSVASAWLRAKIHNAANPDNTISECFVMTNGQPFATESKAKTSKAYTDASQGTMQLISETQEVKDYGVMPDPAGGGGYVVFIRTGIKTDS